MATVIDEETGEITETDEDIGADLPDGDDQDDDETTEPEPEPEPEAPPLSEKELEAALKKLDSEATRHANRVSEIMGADAQTLEPCVLCEPNIPGFRIPVPVDDEKRAAVLAVLGMGDEPEFVTDPGTQTCSYCDGNGATITGSKVQNQVTRVCPQCQGNGWMTDEAKAALAVRQETALVAAAVTGQPVQLPQPENVVPAFDAWQRPQGHEFFGMTPVYMTPEQRARDLPAARGE